MAVKCKLTYLASTEVDIWEIVRFYADQVSPASARDIYREMREQISRLQVFPQLGPLHPDPELAAQGYQKLVLTRTYAAIYRVIDGVVTIYRVVNGKMDYPRLLK